jgi:hypothetical protein
MCHNVILDCLFTDLRPAQEFFTYMMCYTDVNNFRLSPVIKKYQKLAYMRRLHYLFPYQTGFGKTCGTVPLLLLDPHHSLQDLWFDHYLNILLFDRDRQPDNVAVFTPKFLSTRLLAALMGPVRIRVIIFPPHPFANRNKRRLNIE